MSPQDLSDRELLGILGAACPEISERVDRYLEAGPFADGFLFAVRALNISGCGSGVDGLRLADEPIRAAGRRRVSSGRQVGCVPRLAS
jgi:hypothetical protein